MKEDAAPGHDSAISERIASWLLALAATGLAGTLVFGFAWYRARTADLRVEELPIEDRQLLMEQMAAVVPGVHVNAWFEPRIGYTLQPGKRIELPYDTFTANELGYRTGGVAKAPETFRVVFVGDSWTFGHGVRRHESFPAAFEQLANQEGHGVVDRRVEAWTLALSGYNTVNQLAAFWFFVDALQPDAVVLSPSTNDNDSSYFVLPNGSLSRLGKLGDELGDPHPVGYQHIGVDSFRYRERWRAVFREIRSTEGRLRELDIPLLYFFVAQWDEGVVHHFVAEAGLESPYLINPETFRVGRWLDPEYGHGTAEANRLYGRMVYRGLAELLGWRQLAAAGDGSEVELYRHPPAGDWGQHTEEVLGGYTERFIEESFAPPQPTSKQCVGPMSCETGRMGRATTVLVRRRPDADRLRIDLDRIPEARHLYPLELAVTIPSPSGGTRATTTVAAGGDRHRFRVEIPDEIATGAAMDVVFEAERVTAIVRGRRVAGSVTIRSIEQEPAS